MTATAELLLMTPLRHDPKCPHCFGTSVGVYVIDGARTLHIPCPCGVMEDEEVYRPYEEQVRQKPRGRFTPRREE